MTIMSSLPQPLLLLFQLLLVILATYLVLKLLKFISSKVERESKAGIKPPPPPGSCGLPLIGETLAFIRANNSSKGFYDFVDKRRGCGNLYACQITTASAIAWMIRYLDENKEVQERLRVLQLQLAPKIHGSSIGIEALNEMSYASQGFHVQKGWIVNIDARAIHFDPALYDEPLNFLPSRFDEDPKPYNFLAFGVGGRTCLVMNLARAMMLIFLHRLVTTYKWKVTDPDSSLEKWALFPRLRSGFPIRLTPLVPPCFTNKL